MRFRRGSGASAFLVWPTVVVLLLVGVVPFVVALWLSLTDLHFALPDHRGSWVGLANYRALLTDSRYWAAIARTALFVAVCVPLEAIGGALLALVLHGRTTTSRTLTIALMAPVLIAPVTAGLMWRLVLHGDYGPVGYLFFKTVHHSLLAESPYAFLAVCAIDIWQWTPFFVLLAILGFNTCPPAVVTAARIDGATEHQIARHVLLPWARPILLAGAILRFFDAFNEIDKIHGLTGGGPASTTETQNVYAFIVTFVQGNVALGAAMCLLLFVLLGAILNLALPRMKDLIQ